MPVGAGGRKNRGRTRLMLWLQHYLSQDNHATFLNATASAKAAGYRAKSYAAFGVIGHENLEKLKEEIDAYFQSNGLSEQHALQRLRDGLDATTIKAFCHEGEIIYSESLIDWETRRKYVELLMRRSGMFAVERKEHTLNINVRELHEHRAMFERISDEVMRKIIAEENARSNQLKEYGIIPR